MPALKPALKGDNKYNNKSMLFDALWLLKKLRQITAGVDMKANPALTFHEQVVIFFMTQQGQNDSDFDYLLHFNVKFRTLEMSGGDHLMCSPMQFGKSIQKADNDEIEAKKERFKTMCFI